MQASGSDAPEGSLLGKVPFNIFINETDTGMECTLSRFADDMKMSHAVDRMMECHPEGSGKP